MGSFDKQPQHQQQQNIQSIHPTKSDLSISKSALEPLYDHLPPILDANSQQENILSTESDEKQQNNCDQTSEYLTQILSILNTKQTRKLNALESKIYDVETQLKSHTNILQNIYNEIKNYNAQNHETTPTQCEKILHKMHHMDNKIDSIKSKQIKVNKCTEKQIEIMNQLKANDGQIEEALLEQSISMQSINSKQQLNTETLSSINTHLKSLQTKYDSSESAFTNTTTSSQLSSLSKQISSMKTQSNSSFTQLSSLSKQIASIRTGIEEEINYMKRIAYNEQKWFEEFEKRKEQLYKCYIEWTTEENKYYVTKCIYL